MKKDNIVEIRGRSRGWLSTKIGSNCHLVCSVDIKMSEKSQLKIAYFVKGLLFSILKQLQMLSW